VLQLSAVDEPNYSLPGTTVAVRLKHGSKVVSTRVLEVGKDIVEPEVGKSALADCPSQCTQPQVCGDGCCCGGKVCRGRSCVDP